MIEEEAHQMASGRSDARRLGMEHIFIDEVDNAARKAYEGPRPRDRILNGLRENLLSEVRPPCFRCRKFPFSGGPGVACEPGER